jgi:hypothetical protein
MTAGGSCMTLGAASHPAAAIVNSLEWSTSRSNLRQKTGVEGVD